MTDHTALIAKLERDLPIAQRTGFAVAVLEERDVEVIIAALKARENNDV